MAAFDDLLNRIHDPALRADLERELELIRSDRELGLVFERHLPERVRLYHQRIQKGSSVEIENQSDSPVWTVKSIKDKYAIIQRIDDTNAFVEESIKTSDLVAVQEFGKPIFPGLRSVGRLERGGNKPFHTVINAENYHALETLMYAFEGKVDVIYIDPPYNTGDRSWKYNNDFVDLNDGYRHSKWLSFMEKRLILAKKLLRPDDGVLIVTIDEHEVHRLALLLQQIFPNYIHTMLTTVINPKGTIRGQFGRVEEYALFVIPNGIENLIAGKIIDSPSTEVPDEDHEYFENDLDDSDEESDLPASSDEPEDLISDEDSTEYEFQLFRRRGSSSLREDRPNRFFPIYIDEKKGQIVDVGETLPIGQNPTYEKVKGLRPIWPIDSEGNHRVWRWQVSRVREILSGPDSEGRYLKLGRYNPVIDNWTINLAVPKRSTVKQKTVWWETRHDSGTHGTTLIQKFLGKVRQFSYPKSLYLVRDTLDVVVRNRPEALILDFFAGSGTTAHATALLNQVDNGTRRSIMVTNNELESKTGEVLRKKGLGPGDKEYDSNGIFWNVTKPRMEAAISGNRQDGKPVPGTYIDKTPFAVGLPENIEFFELTYENPDQVQLGKAFVSIAPILWLMSGSTGDYILKPNNSMEISKSGLYGILFDPNKWPEFALAVKKALDMTHAFIVTDSDSVFQKVVAELPDSVKSVRLYESYLSTFSINSGARH